MQAPACSGTMQSAGSARTWFDLKEGVLRGERVTWTGHVRDTGLFSILAHEWAARRA